jgi:hypothetical protein
MKRWIIDFSIEVTADSKQEAVRIASKEAFGNAKQVPSNIVIKNVKEYPRIVWDENNLKELDNLVNTIFYKYFI